MTKSLFHAPDNAEMVQRIQLVRPDSKPQWGKMDAAQTMAHCQKGFQVATGELVLRRSFIGLLIGRLAKKQLAGEKPFGRNLPTDKTFVVRDSRDFARERSQLTTLVQRCGQNGPACLTERPHPFFGPLSAEEWLEETEPP